MGVRPARQGFPLRKFLTDEQPSLANEALVLALLFAFAGWLRASNAWQTAVFWKQSDEISVLVAMNLLFFFWPISTLVTYLVSRVLGNDVPFARVLHATGKVWLLYTAMLLIREIVVVALSLLRLYGVVLSWFRWWQVPMLATLWLVYPFTISVIYGTGRGRSCLLTLLTYGITAFVAYVFVIFELFIPSMIKLTLF